MASFEAIPGVPGAAAAARSGFVVFIRFTREPVLQGYASPRGRSVR
jgi:hypothetical protein